MQDILVPAMGESITEGSISRWAVQVGDQVKQGDLLLELETDKVNLEISAEQDGVIAEILFKEGDTVQIGQVIGRIGKGSGAAPAPAAQPASAPAAAPAATPAAAPAAAAPAPASAPAAAAGSQPPATPAARKLAREQGIDLSQTPARDPLGRIHADDVRNAGSRPAAPAPAAPAAAPAA
ncbi:biotin/lipoyl-containing protein, partial [Cohnella nanjingensis]